MNNPSPLTLLVFKVGFLCGRMTNRSSPSTMADVYDIMNEVGIGIEKGDSTATVEKKVDDFIKRKCYETAMKVI